MLFFSDQYPCVKDNSVLHLTTNSAYDKAASLSPSSEKNTHLQVCRVYSQRTKFSAEISPLKAQKTFSNIFKIFLRELQTSFSRFGDTWFLLDSDMMKQVPQFQFQSFFL